VHAGLDQNLVGTVELIHIPINRCIDLAEAPPESLTCMTLGLGVHGLELSSVEPQVHGAPDQQIALADHDARAMATSMRSAGIVDYNVQGAADDEHHLIVAHEVTNIVIDKSTLAPMAAKAKQAMRTETLAAFADRGYFSGECEKIGVTPYVPKPRTSNARVAGRLDKEDFDYLPEKNAYRCPAGEMLPFRMISTEGNQTIHLLLEQQLCRLCFEIVLHNEQGTTCAASNCHGMGIRAFSVRETPSRRCGLSSKIVR
jgi:hypothetical protein